MATTDFSALRAALQEGQRAAESRTRELLLAGEQRKRLAAERERLARRLAAGGEDSDALRALDTRIAEADRRLQGLRAAHERLNASLRGALDAFAQSSDPRRQLGELDDATPVLLLPLRIETRFKRLATGGRELWVRVYPDECLVDTFEPSLTDAEVKQARAYHAALWRAGDVEADRRAAWRDLAASHGTGRALWVAEQYRPLNAQEQPQRAADTVILVITTDVPLAGVEATAIPIYWAAVWRADSHGAAVAQAQQALVDAVGAARANAIGTRYRPYNLADPPPAGTTRQDAQVVVATLVFPGADEVETRRRAWSRAPQVALLPERLVLLGWVDGQQTLDQLGALRTGPLVAGLDPQAPPANQIRQDGDDIVVSDEIRWMVDFDEAVRIGMGFRVPLTDTAFRRGFDRLAVLGVRLGSDADDGRRRFEDLLADHHRSRNGFALLPQGTPTNNTEEEGAGWTSRDDPELGYDLVASGGWEPDPGADWFERADGQWLADALGLDPASFRLVQHAGRSDVADAQAMNVALWPATLGYTLDTQLASVFDDATVGFVRTFFTRQVSGRGMTPALRIGRQPYGVLPAVAYSRMRFDSPGGTGVPLVAEANAARLAKLHEVLMRAHGTWGELLAQVSRVGKNGDAHQILLDILGLHPNSVEHHTRLAQSIDQVVNSLNLGGFGGAIVALLLQLALLAQGTEVLAAHGYDTATQGRPDLLDKYFRRQPTPVTAPLIHDDPLSETTPLAASTGDGRNYLAWLADGARSSLETVRLEQGFGDAGTPRALLYAMLRHALLLGYYETGVKLYQRAGRLSGSAIAAARSEPSFVHVAPQAPEISTGESRFRLLYQPDAAVTGNADLLVAEFIPQLLAADPLAAPLSAVIAAIDRLKDLSTARLERTFVEHLDVCSYRLDAWLQGLAQHQLWRMRFPDDELSKPRRGLYLGAWGWLEDVKPDAQALEPVDLPDADLRAIFQPEGAAPLERDPQNAGYMHAPSLDQAVTAAILRNGYLSNATPSEPGVFAVNLSSERVRRAMAAIEGVRNGQSLGALLGYQFERGLHDRHGQAEVDAFIYKLRKQFPLRADRIAATASDPDTPIQTVEARNVLDGVALVEHVEKSGQRSYPFGMSALPDANPAQREAIDAEVARLLDTNDAVADLAIAEGLHQVIQGNYDRSAALLDAFGLAQLPPQPEVVGTPRSGTGLTHRVGLHLRPGLGIDHTPYPALAPTPRARAEPALNDWLASVLPQPNDVVVVVRLKDGTGLVDTRAITQRELGLQPLDLLFMLRTDSEQAMGVLDDRLWRHVQGEMRPDGEIAIAYTERIAGKVSLFELAALVGELRALVLKARSLRATDLALPTEATRRGVVLASWRVERVARIAADLAVQLVALRDLHAEVATLLVDAKANEADLIDHIDERVERLVAALAGLEPYGLPQTGFGFALDWRRRSYQVLVNKLDDLDRRWQARLDQFATALTACDALPPGTTDETRMEALREIEKIVAMVGVDPLPAVPPAVYRADVIARRAGFATKKAAFAAVEAANPLRLATLLSDIVAESADLQQYDFVRLNLDADIAEIVRFCGEFTALAGALVADIDQRLATAAAALADYPAAATDDAREAAATAAVHALLGEDFLVLPEFVLPADAATDLAQSHAAHGGLLAHLAAAGHDFPVDDWLYGVARVRPPMAHWEATTMFANALAGAAPDLHPMQLPYRANDAWLALAFPPNYVFDGERLLYSAHFATPFVAAASQCGLLLDEWTEVIPAREETTGLAFHYDRPNAEPPQAMLLALPPQLRGQWQWGDLVAAVEETMELAHRRAVEPDHIDATSYARFVPATVASSTARPITIAMTLAALNPGFQFAAPPGANHG